MRTWANYYVIGQIFIFVNGQTLVKSGHIGCNPFHSVTKYHQPRVQQVLCCRLKKCSNFSRYFGSKTPPIYFLLKHKFMLFNSETIKNVQKFVFIPSEQINCQHLS